jgi:hypothetical protein
VLTFRWARTALAGLLPSTWSSARLSAAAALSVAILGLILSAAYADGIVVGGCVGQNSTLNCVARWGDPTDPYVRKVPEPVDDAERQRSAEREHKWEARCRPQIAQDYFGVPRYVYAAPGCQFGVIE